jgi:hypothetical protein
MRKFIADLFAAKTTRPASPRTRLGFEVMEDRYAPALLLNPGTLRGFNPQPEPPGDVTLTAEIIAIQPTSTRLG